MLSKRGRRSSLSSERLTSSSWTSRLSPFSQPAVIPTRVDNKPQKTVTGTTEWSWDFYSHIVWGYCLLISHPCAHFSCSIPKKITVGVGIPGVPTLPATLYYQTWTVFSVCSSELCWIDTIQCIKLLREYRYRTLCFGSGLDPESTRSVDPVQESINDPQKNKSEGISCF